jgi:hypothetical protein
VIKGQQLTESEQIALFLQWRDNINETGDAQLIAKFQFILDNIDNPQLLDQGMTEFFIYLMETTPNIPQ